METSINHQIEKRSKDQKNFNILYVDAEEVHRRIFRNDFCRNYKLFLAGSASEALRILEEIEVHLMMIDPGLDDMCGVELLQKAVKINPEIIKIMISAREDAQLIIKAVNAVKIDKYLTKPWNKIVLKEIMDKELMKFRPIEPFTLDDLPHLNFQSRIGDEILAENCEVGDPLSNIFRNSFEIKNYPYESRSNFQWVGQSKNGHKVVILLNMIQLKKDQEEIKRCMAQSIEEVLEEQDKALDSALIDKITSCYRTHLTKVTQKENRSELNICALFIHEDQDSVQYFSNYHGLKLFDRSLNQFKESESGDFSYHEISRIFIFSDTFNAHCLGDLTYSQLINESIEMDLERQGHFLEMEVLNSPLIASNVSIVGIEINNSNNHLHTL